MKSQVRQHWENWQVSKKQIHVNHECDGDGDDGDVNVDADVSVYDESGHLRFSLNRPMKCDCCFLLLLHFH